jgi:hypothetical protein
MNICKNIVPHCKGQVNNHGENQGIESSENLAEAIKIATDRNKLPHPRGISQTLFDEFANELSKREIEISQAQNFHELIKIVRNGKIKGIGNLNIYDVAERIGQFLKLYPEMVYLHSGTDEGAKIYFGDKYKEVAKREDGFRVIRKEHFLPKFEKYTCDELESHLCMTKGRLDEILKM